MKCQKCNGNFEEKDIQLSHDIPKYMGGVDLDGRHWLCKKCHGIYEWRIIELTWEHHSYLDQRLIKDKIQKFSIKYFGESDDTKTTPES